MLRARQSSGRASWSACSWSTRTIGSSVERIASDSAAFHSTITSVETHALVSHHSELAYSAARAPRAPPPQRSRHHATLRGLIA